MRCIFVAAFLLPLGVSAGNLGLVFDTFSNHLGAAKSPHSLSDDLPAELADDYYFVWNEHNETLGLEYRFDSGFSLTAANYTDSYLRDTWYGGAGWMWRLYQRGDFAIDGGGYVLYFTHQGYTEDVTPPEGVDSMQLVMPSRSYVAPLPGLSVRYKLIGANLAIIPPIEDGVPWTGGACTKFCV